MAARGSGEHVGRLAMAIDCIKQPNAKENVGQGGPMELRLAGMGGRRTKLLGGASLFVSPSAGRVSGAAVTISADSKSKVYGAALPKA